MLLGAWLYCVFLPDLSAFLRFAVFTIVEVLKSDCHEPAYETLANPYHHNRNSFRHSRMGLCDPSGGIRRDCSRAVPS